MKHPSSYPPEVNARNAGAEPPSSSDAAGPIRVSVHHVEHPSPGLRQAVWWEVAGFARASPSDRYAEAIVRIELDSGVVHCLRFIDLDVPVWEILASLGKALSDDLDWPQLMDRLAKWWLVPPMLRGMRLSEVSVQPQRSELDDSLQRVAWRAGWMGTVIESAPAMRGAKVVADDCTASAVRAAADAFEKHLALQVRGTIPPLLRGKDDSLDLGAFNQIMCWPEPTRRRRLQALASYPWLWREVGLRIESGHQAGGATMKRRPPRVSLAIAKAIDQGRPLLRIMGVQYRIRPSAIRSLSQVPLFLLADPLRATAIAWMFDAVPQEWQPSFAHETDAAHVLLGWLSSMGWLHDRPLIRCIARDIFWRKRRAFFRYWDLVQQNQDDLEDHDLLLVFASPKSNDPGSKSRRSRRSARRALRRTIMGVGMLSVIEEGISMFAPHLHYEPDGVGAEWKPVLVVPYRCDDRVIVELSSSESLAEEGRVMKHCVASRWREILGGYSAVFSLRDEEGRHRSTLHLSKEGGTWHAVEHRAFRNADPESTCERAAVSLVQHLNQRQAPTGAVLAAH